MRYDTDTSIDTVAVTSLTQVFNAGVMIRMPGIPYTLDRHSRLGICGASPDIRPSGALGHDWVCRSPALSVPACG